MSREPDEPLDDELRVRPDEEVPAGSADAEVPAESDDEARSESADAGRAQPVAARRSDPGVEARPKARPRDVAIVAGRTTAGVVVAAVAATVAFASTFIVPPTWSVTAPSLAVAPTAAPQELVCPGGLLRLGSDTGAGASNLSPVGAPRTAWAADTSVEVRGLSATNASTEGTPAAAEIGTVAVAESGVASAAGLQSEIVDAGIAGLATTACTAPASGQWLVAGATTLGRTSLLVLTNPGAVEAAVDIELYGESGRVAAAGLEGIRLAPDEQRVVPLNGFAVDVVAPVVRVTSTGARVVAALQQSIVRSLATGGVELVSAQRPEHSLVIPGVRVQAKAELAPIDVSEVDHDDISPVLRLFAPGGDEVETTIALVPDGSSLADALAAREDPSDEPGHTHHDHEGEAHEVAEPRSFGLTLTPGLVTEYAIEEVAAGDYTVVVTAGQPVVGAVRTSSLVPSSGAAPLVDFAWASPAAPMADRAVLALPPLVDGTGGVPGVSARGAVAAAPAASPAPGAAAPLGADGFRGYVLWLANPTGEPVTVTLTIGEEAPADLDIAPGTTEWVELAAGATVAADGLRGLSAAILGVGPGLLSHAPLQPPGQLASEVLVRF